LERLPGASGDVERLGGQGGQRDDGRVEALGDIGCLAPCDLVSQVKRDVVSGA
jgi:hypothetical protein